MTVNDRLEAVMKSLGLNQNSLANKLGLSKTVVFNIIAESGRRNAPSHGFYQKLKSSFDNINLNWLITGQGEMFSEDVQVSSKEDVQPILQEPPIEYKKPQSAETDLYAILGDIRSELKNISNRVSKLEEGK